MKLRRELKIGIFAVIVILVSWWGIKWLGGQNLLKRTQTYYVYFDDVTGLMESARVNLRGVEVGNVQTIELLGDNVMVELSVESDYADFIPANSIAEIGSTGLMGGQEIFIIQGDSEARIADGATMEGRVNAGITGLLADKGSSLIDGLNTHVEGVNENIGANRANIEAMVAHLESMTASIDSLLASSKGDIEGAMNDLSTFTSALAANTGKIESMISSLDTFTSDVAEADFVTKLDATLASINDIVASLESGQGSVGMLLKDAELYNSLNDAGENLALLLEDLKANPMRYVHFSLFGQSEEKIAEKAAKKAEREAKRAARKAE